MNKLLKDSDMELTGDTTKRMKEHPELNVLVVCNANLNRSPTIEHFLRKNCSIDREGRRFHFRSAGIYYGYPYQVNPTIMNWADFVIVMDLEQQKFILERYGIVAQILGISDEYDRGSKKLIGILEWYFIKNVPFSDWLNWDLIT